MIETIKTIERICKQLFSNPRALITLIICFSIAFYAVYRLFPIINTMYSVYQHWEEQGIPLYIEVVNLKKELRALIAKHNHFYEKESTNLQALNKEVTILKSRVAELEKNSNKNSWSELQRPQSMLDSEKINIILMEESEGLKKLRIQLRSVLFK